MRVVRTNSAFKNILEPILPMEAFQEIEGTVEVRRSYSGAEGDAML
jgi:hypothetical protein